MAKFSTLKPEDVLVGRGRGAAISRAPYIEAVRDSQAGKIKLERGEKPATAKRLLQEASKSLGIRIRSSVVTVPGKQTEILWRRVGA